MVTALAALFAGITLTALVGTAFALRWWRKHRSVEGGKQQVRMQHALPVWMIAEFKTGPASLDSTLVV